MGVLTEHFTLTNGLTIPKLGFGTWQTPNDEAPKAVAEAIELGYTHIDTARAYKNEAGVSQGIRDAGVNRESLYITTKVPADMKSYEDAKAAIETSMRELNLGYIDLLLIHAPKPWPVMFTEGAPRYFEENRAVWKAMEEAVKRGDVRSIGVSNFQVDDLTNLTDVCEIVPTANQIRFHIGYTQSELTAYCQDKGIVVEAYSPIGTGKLLNNPQIAAVADGLGVSVAQVCIRYALQKGCLPLPKSTHREYIKQNADIDFEIGADDMAMLDGLDLA